MADVQRLVVVEDDLVQRQLLEKVLADVLDLQIFEDFEDFEKWHEENGCLGCSVLWVDVSLPGRDGWACFGTCANYKVLPKRVVICSGVVDLRDDLYADLISELRKETEVMLLQKPLTFDTIRKAVFGDYDG